MVLRYFLIHTLNCIPPSHSQFSLRHSSSQQIHTPTDPYCTNSAHTNNLTYPFMSVCSIDKRQADGHARTRTRTLVHAFESCCLSLGLSRAGSLIVACKAGTLNGAVLAVGQEKNLKLLLPF